MAELLIKLKNNAHSNSAKDRMCYKRGDIVVYMPDGHVWGKEESLPKFAVIQTDANAAQVKKFIAVHKTPQPHAEAVLVTEWTEMQTRKQYGRFITKPVTGALSIAQIDGKNRQFITLTGVANKPHTRRRYRLHLNSLTPLEKNTLTSTGKIFVPFVKLRRAMKDKITGAQA